MWGALGKLFGASLISELIDILPFAVCKASITELVLASLIGCLVGIVIGFIGGALVFSIHCRTFVLNWLSRWFSAARPSPKVKVSSERLRRPRALQELELLNE